MGLSGSKKSKINKNHDKQKVFRIGISAGRNDLNLEGHFQLGYHGKTVKNYTPIENHLQTNKNKVDEPVANINE